MRRVIKRGDADGDGKIAKDEYIVFFCQKLGQVPTAEVINVLGQQFDALDYDKNGHLDGKDVEMLIDAIARKEKADEIDESVLDAAPTKAAQATPLNRMVKKSAGIDKKKNEVSDEEARKVCTSLGAFPVDRRCSVPLRVDITLLLALPWCLPSALTRAALAAQLPFARSCCGRLGSSSPHTSASASCSTASGRHGHLSHRGRQRTSPPLSHSQ